MLPSPWKIDSTGLLIATREHQFAFAYAIRTVDKGIFATNDDSQYSIIEHPTVLSSFSSLSRILNRTIIESPNPNVLAKHSQSSSPFGLWLLIYYSKYLAYSTLDFLGLHVIILLIILSKGVVFVRKILNFFIVGLVLWLSSLLFPEHIKFSGFPAIVLTTVLIYVVITIVMLAVFGTLALIGVEKIAVWIVCFIVFALFSGTATLLIISYLYDGFSLSGFWTAFLLSFCLSLFTTDIKRNQ